MDNTCEKMVNIIKGRYNLDFSSNWDDMQNEHLLGSKIRLGASELLYLYVDIEKEFGIEIPEEHIVSGSFGTLRSIVKMIDAQLTAKAEVEV